MSLRHLSLLPFCLLAGCQLWPATPPATQTPGSRVQGQLVEREGQWSLQPCGGAHGLQLEIADPALREELQSFGSPAFADLGGRLGAANGEAESQLTVQQRYRLQHEGAGCDDPRLSQTQLRASGHEPEWHVEVEAAGLLLTRPGQPPLALPYVEEQLPGGGVALSSQANGQRLELWLTPQRCTDSMTGAISHLSAQLRLDGEMNAGCGYYGALRR